MKHLRAYESNFDGWIKPINGILNVPIAKEMDDIRDDVKSGDIVIGVWFSGGFESYVLRVEEERVDGDNDLGVLHSDTWYSLEHAYFVLSYEDYIKKDTTFEMRLEMDGETKKFNL